MLRIKIDSHLRPLLFYSNKDTSSDPPGVDCVRNIFLSFDATRRR